MTDTRWATFDCFGTLVDWRHGIATGAELIAPGQGRPLLEAYERHEPDVQRASPTMRYRDVLAQTLRRACAELAIGVHEDDLDVLATGLPYWPVFPDVRPALTRLRQAGWNLALLTNCDRDLVGQTMRRLGVTIDLVVTAEDAGAYKPSLHHFHRFRAASGVADGSWVHVAQGYRHDIRPAHGLGIPRVWINRLGQPDEDLLASAVLPGLDGLDETVEAVRGRAARS